MIVSSLRSSEWWWIGDQYNLKSTHQQVLRNTIHPRKLFYSKRRMHACPWQVTLLHRVQDDDEEFGGIENNNLLNNWFDDLSDDLDSDDDDD